MTTPRKRSVVRSNPLTTDREVAAGTVTPRAGYTAVEIITIGMPPEIAARKGRRSARSARCGACTATVPASVVVVAYPRPGKCFAVATNPPEDNPRAKAPPRVATAVGVLPNVRGVMRAAAPNVEYGR